MSTPLFTLNRAEKITSRKSSSAPHTLTHLSQNTLYQQTDTAVYFHRHISILGACLTISLILFFVHPYLQILALVRQSVPSLYKLTQVILFLIIIFESLLILLKMVILWLYVGRQGTESAEKLLGVRKFEISPQDWSDAKLLGMPIERYMQEKETIFGKAKPPVTQSSAIVTEPADEEIDDIFQGPAVQMRDEYNSQSGSTSDAATTDINTLPFLTSPMDTSQLRTAQPFLRKTPQYLRSVHWNEQAPIQDANDLHDYLNEFKRNPYSIQARISKPATSVGGFSASAYGVPDTRPTSTGSSFFGSSTDASRGTSLLDSSTTPRYSSSVDTFPSTSRFGTGAVAQKQYRGITITDQSADNDFATSLSDYSNEDIPRIQEVYKEAQLALRQLHLDTRQLASWTDNVRKWIVENILKTLTTTVDALNKELKNRSMSAYDCNVPLDEPPLPGTRIPDNIPPPIDGRLTLRYILAVCCQNDPILKNRLIIEHYLDIPYVPRKYILKRVKELSASAYMESYKWNSGSSFEGTKWEQRKDLPNDAHIIMHLFRKWMDLLFPSDPTYGQTAFSMKHFVEQRQSLYGRSSAGTAASDSSLYILQESAQPPHFSLVYNKKHVQIEPGRHNLFFTLCIFIYIVKVHFKGTLDQVWLGASHYNVLKVVEEENGGV